LIDAGSKSQLPVRHRDLCVGIRSVPIVDRSSQSSAIDWRLTADLQQLLNGRLLLCRRMPFIVVVDQASNQFDLGRANIRGQVEAAIVEREHDPEQVLEIRFR
jgi:hypothetical protein